MNINKESTNMSKGFQARDSLRTPERQRAPLSFKNISSKNSVDHDSNNNSPKYKDLFAQDQHDDESSQAPEDVESSISISDQEDGLDDEQFSDQERRDLSPVAETKALDRWKILYAQKEKYELKREQLRKEKKAPEADPECTFKPRLLSSNANIPSASKNLPIHERNRLWKEKQQAKLKETSQKEKQRGMTDCTFKPTVNSATKKARESDVPLNQGCRGVNQFIKRQAAARQHKEEKEAILSNPLSRLPEHATKREGKTTVGKYPNLLTSSDKAVENSASKKNSEAFSAISPKTKSQTPLKNRRDSHQEISFSNDICKTEASASENLIYVSDVTYFDAIRKLREELHRIPLNID